MNQKTYQKNEIVFRQGEPGSRMYDILSGRVGIYINYGTPEEKLLTELDRDRCFGEMALLDETVRSATAVALENGSLLAEIAKEDFSAYFQGCPEKVIGILQQLSGRLRELTGDYMDACKTVTEAARDMENGKPCAPELAEKLRFYASQAENS